MSCQPSPYSAQFLATSEVVEVERLSNTEAVFTVGEFSEPIFVQMLDSSVFDGPTYRDWTLVDVSGFDVGFGLHLEGDTLFGDGVVNLLYMASGYIIKNGSVLMSAPAMQIGDTVRLWFDPESGVATFYLNGVEVA